MRTWTDTWVRSVCCTFIRTCCWTCTRSSCSIWTIIRIRSFAISRIRFGIWRRTLLRFQMFFHFFLNWLARHLGFYTQSIVLLLERSFKRIQTWFELLSSLFQLFYLLWTFLLELFIWLSFLLYIINPIFHLLYLFFLWVLFWIFFFRSWNFLLWLFRFFWSII